VDIGPNRRFAWLRVGLEPLGEIRETSGATLNDVVLAIVTGAVRAFLLRRGCAVRALEFRVMVPVSVRTSDERGQLGNRVSQLLVPLPLDAEDPLERLRLVCERTRELKGSGQAEGGQLLTNLSELLLPGAAGVLERIAARRGFGNMIVTNVPGADFTAHLLGARLRESYPLVPLSPRQALNVAVLSYDGSLHWGINADFDAVPDVADFVTLLGEAVEALYKQALARRAGASPIAQP
jgi:WS/DGAT/MGAT family acyltransferase